MKVYIDSRERDKSQKIYAYWKLNQKKFSHIESIDTKVLASGDVCTSDGFVGIERKSKADFVGSVCSGKLRQQLFELKQNFENAFLLVEGYDSIKDCIEKTPQIHPNVFIGITSSSLAHWRVPITYVGNFYIPILLSTIEKFYDGNTEKYEKNYTPIRRSTTKNEHKLNIVTGLPDIKDVLAKSLLSHFNNSIREIANADEEELMRIKGIGKNKAQKIVKLLK